MRVLTLTLRYVLTQCIDPDRSPLQFRGLFVCEFFVLNECQIIWKIPLTPAGSSITRVKVNWPAWRLSSLLVSWTLFLSLPSTRRICKQIRRQREPETGYLILEMKASAEGRLNIDPHSGSRKVQEPERTTLTFRRASSSTRILNRDGTRCSAEKTSYD